MDKKFEFWCPGCGERFLRAVPDVASCPDCQAPHLILVAMIVIARDAGIFTGYPMRRLLTFDR